MWRRRFIPTSHGSLTLIFTGPIFIFMARLIANTRTGIIITTAITLNTIVRGRAGIIRSRMAGRFQTIAQLLAAHRKRSVVARPVFSKLRQLAAVAVGDSLRPLSECVGFFLNQTRGQAPH